MSEQLLAAIAVHAEIATDACEPAGDEDPEQDSQRAHTGVESREQKNQPTPIRTKILQRTTTPVKQKPLPRVQMNVDDAAKPTSNKRTCKICQRVFPTEALLFAHDLFSHALSGERVKDMKRDLQKWKTDEPLHARLLEELKGVPVDEELEKVYKIYRFDPQMIERVCGIVQVDLAQMLPRDIIVRPFGSMQTGLAVRDADLDIHLEDTSGKHNHANMLRMLHKRMRQSNAFDCVMYLSKARVPIITCTHRLTNMKVDINMYPCSQHTTRLIAALSGHDERLKQLLFFFKVWSKHHKIVYTGFFNSYCIVMMVVHYLQYLGLLPPISDLQVGQPPQYVNGVNYCIDATRLPQLPVKLNVRLLIRGFFKFYNSLPLLTTVCSLHHGRTIPKAQFSEETCPGYEAQVQRVTQVTGMAPKPFDPNALVLFVQDPFQLTLNCSALIQAKRVQRINALFKWASGVCNKLMHADASVFYEALLLARSSPDRDSGDKPAVVVSANEKETNGNVVPLQPNAASTEDTKAPKKRAKKKKRKKQPNTTGLANKSASSSGTPSTLSNTNGSAASNDDVNSEAPLTAPIRMAATTTIAMEN